MKISKRRHLAWIDITITLIALEIMAYFYFGIRTAVMVVMCMLTSLVTDFISVKLMKREFSGDDLISVADGAALALMMPASIEYKIPVVSCIFAVLIGKNLFGGRKNIIFSPAAAGYLFAVTSWGEEVLMYPEIGSKPGLHESVTELSHSLSYVFNTTGKINISDFEILLGNFEGPVGTVSILLLMVTAIVLIFRKAISAGAFTGLISGLLFMSYICPVNDSRTESLKYVLATNMFLFAGIYIVSDKRVAPLKNYYSFFYGLFIALISYILLLTTGKENMVVTVSVLMTPAALILKEIQRRTDDYMAEEKLAAESAAAENTPDNNDISCTETETDEINLIAQQGIAEINSISADFSEWDGDDEFDYDGIYDMMPEESDKK